MDVQAEQAGAVGNGGASARPPRVWTDMAAFDRWFEEFRRDKRLVSGFEHAAFFRWLTLGAPGSAPAPDPMPPYPADLPWPDAPGGPSAAATPPPEEVPWDDPPPDESAAPPEADAGPRVLPLDLLVAYSDGSGNTAARPSGAGVVILDARPEAVAELGRLEGAVVIAGAGVVVLEASAHLGNGTNNHAEVCASGLALAMTDVPGWRERPLEVRTDSTYVQWAFRQKADLPPQRANARIINALRKRRDERPGPSPADAPLPPRRVTTFHVPGHAGEPGNERADELAGLARLRPKAATP